MAIGKRVTVTSTATVIHTPDAHSNAELVLTNSGSVAVDLGDATVTAGGGFQLAAGASMVLQISSPTSLYGIVASGSAVLQVLVPDGEGNQAPSPSGSGTLLVESSSLSKGYAQATSTGTAALLSSLVTIPSGATKVLITPSAAIHIRDDGTPPTATVGYPVAASAEFQYDGDKLSALQVIGAATLDCFFYA